MKLKGKIAEDGKEAWKIQETYTGKPHGWIQWKGTTVSMEIYCSCGAAFHVDADFAYYVECSECKRVYFCNAHIEVIEVKNVDRDTHIIGGDEVTCWKGSDEEKEEVK